MSTDGVISWAKKMSEALGKSAAPAPIGVPVGAPSKPGSSTGGGTGANGGPAVNTPAKPASPPGGGGPNGGGGAPKGGGSGAPAGGGAPAKPGDPAGAAPNGAGAPPTIAAPPTNKGNCATPDGAPAPTPAVAAPAGNGAKENALAAQKAFADINALLSQVKTVEGELKKPITDAQALKKQIDDESRKLEAALKSLPPAMQVPAPQGKDAAARYDSAIQNTGKVRKAQQDAEAKVISFRGFNLGQEVKIKADTSLQQSQQGLNKVKQLTGQAGDFAQAAANASNASAAAAAESKKKADQATKDKSADKDALQKTAQEDAKHVIAAKDASGKAQAIGKQLEAVAKNADTQRQSAEKLNQDTKAAAEAFEKQQATIVEKVQPYQKAVDQAEKTEAECKQKLIEEKGDPEAVLKKRYEQLGGDAELKKALADEDKEFDIIEARSRADAEEWLKRKNGQLDDYKAEVKSTHARATAQIAKIEEWCKQEKGTHSTLAGEAKGEGPKMQTEPGKELQYELDVRDKSIQQKSELLEDNKKGQENLKAVLDALNQRYDAVKKQYDSLKKYIEQTRTEVDNMLQMDGMTLDQKVDFLQTRPKPVRDRIQKQLQNQVNETLKINEAHTEAQKIESTPAPEIKLDALNWEPVKTKLADIKKKTLEQLKENDPQLAALQGEYDKAGGDTALLEKRTNEWKSKVEAADLSDKKYSETYRKRAEELRAQYDAATANVKDTEGQRAAIAANLAHYEGRLKELKEIKDRTTQQEAEYQLAERESKRLKTQLANQEELLATSKASKESAAKLIDAERERYEKGIKIRASLPKPDAEAIKKMPLRPKYTELTGKEAPAGATAPA